jgi:hypothetical protein
LEENESKSSLLIPINRTNIYRVRNNIKQSHSVLCLYTIGIL